MQRGIELRRFLQIVADQLKHDRSLLSYQDMKP
jgi:hypothetical protein